MDKRKWMLIGLGAIIFAGVGVPVAGNQREVEFRLAERARDFCYADAGYGDRISGRALNPPEAVIRKCTRPILDWEGREPLRLGFGILAGLVALLPYLAILWFVRRRRRRSALAG